MDKNKKLKYKSKKLDSSKHLNIKMDKNHSTTTTRLK